MCCPCIAEILSKAIEFGITIFWKTVKKIRDVPKEVQKIEEELGDLRDSIYEADKDVEAERDDRLREDKKRKLMQSRKELFLKEDVIDEHDIRIGHVPPSAGFFSKGVFGLEVVGEWKVEGVDEWKCKESVEKVEGVWIGRC